MKQSEKLVEQTLVSEIKKVGGLTFKMLVVNFAGFPDRLCLVRGKAFFIECKTTGKNPTPIQRCVHRKLREQLFNVYVCDTTDSVKKAISENI